MEKVIDLFMQENDLEALELLYQITNDKIVKIAIEWYNEFEEIKICEQTNEFFMYDDIIGYIWEKYNLSEQNK